jgi:hypothetical protein
MEDDNVLLARLDERYKALDAKLDTIIDNQEDHRYRMDDHDVKLNQLFNWRSEVKGGWRATTALGATIGAISAYIGNKIFG